MKKICFYTSGLLCIISIIGVCLTAFLGRIGFYNVTEALIICALWLIAGFFSGVAAVAYESES